MTPAERTAYDTTGKQLSLRPTATSPRATTTSRRFVDEVDNGTELEVTALAARSSWSDPANQSSRPTIRGVHYCTVWAPTWAYWWMTEGAFV